MVSLCSICNSTLITYVTFIPWVCRIVLTNTKLLTNPHNQPASYKSSIILNASCYALDYLWTSRWQNERQHRTQQLFQELFLNSIALLVTNHTKNSKYSVRNEHEYEEMWMKECAKRYFVNKNMVKSRKETKKLSPEATRERWIQLCRKFNFTEAKFPDHGLLFAIWNSSQIETTSDVVPVINNSHLVVKFSKLELGSCHC